jgi:hypothetical protein
MYRQISWIVSVQAIVPTRFHEDVCTTSRHYLRFRTNRLAHRGPGREVIAEAAAQAQPLEGA